MHGACRFHLLKPEYIHHRIKELQRSFRLRVLMCHVDIDDVIEPLQQITRAALLNDVTLICGWSYEVSVSAVIFPIKEWFLASRPFTCNSGSQVIPDILKGKITIAQLYKVSEGNVKLCSIHALR